MLGNPYEDLLRANELEGFMEGPSVAVHEKGGEDDEGAVDSIVGVDEAAHRVQFGHLDKFVDALQFL
jgi:hypothetical protein